MGGIREAWRMFRRARRITREGFKRYAGTPNRICRAIIADTYDRENGYFRTSAGHFCEFYVRDFSWCCDALMRLGYRKEVARTVRYALDAFMRAGRVGTMITPEGEVYDFPCAGPDSLALFLLTLDRTRTRLTDAEKGFLQRETDRFARRFVDAETWLPKAGRFTSMRDHARRERSCYDMTMLCVVAKQCERLKLRFPTSSKTLQRILVREYWNGRYFFSDIRKQDIVTGDANTIPFWTGVITDRTMRGSALGAIHAAGLDEPFPLKYVNAADKLRERVGWHLASVFAPGYEADSAWAHLGVLYLGLLKGHDRRRFAEHMRMYAALLKEHGTFLEVYDADGQPYRTPFYVTDEAMLWCAPWLTLRS